MAREGWMATSVMEWYALATARGAKIGSWTPSSTILAGLYRIWRQSKDQYI